MVEMQREVSKTETLEDLADGREDLRFGDEAVGPDDVDVALIELAKAPPPRAIGAPHGLDLIAFEKAW